MSKRRISVDYGPMSLHVGEDGPASATPRPLPADDGAAAQMRAGRLSSPFELLADAERAPRATAGEVGGEIERLWVSDLSSGTREIRAAMSPRLLPRTQLRMAELEGRLLVELCVDCDETRRWLAFSLPALGRDLGARLKRDLLVLLFDADNAAQPAQRFRWPEDAEQ